MTKQLALAIASAVFLAVGATAEAQSTSAEIQAQWQSPPRQYSSAPLWVWNEMMTEELVRSTLRDLAGQQVRQAFVHPRPGLMTPYLSDEWFRLWQAALDEARKLDVDLWIYDENSYPSGFAGGFVPVAMPESQGRSLALREVKAAPPAGETIVAVFQAQGDDYREVTAALRAGQTLPAGRYLVAELLRSPASPWYGGKTYVDLLYPGVTEKFLEITLEPYRQRLGNEFGKRIPGSFTDEPRLEGRGGIPWTPDLPALFEKRWGYPLVAHLPSLVRPTGDWRRVRHNFLQTLLDTFIDRWAKPYHDYCAKHKLEFTGHYWEHEWPRCEIVPDNMAMYSWHQRPAIDCLMNQYKEDTHGQFGNVRMVKELSSVANQLGLRRTLCEAYGAGGWDLRFEDMKRIGDWLYVLGVNTLDEHLSYVTLRGARKNDHPQSFSYHEPWWDDYHVIARYFTRLSLALSAGEEVNHVLLLQPTTTAWMYQFARGAKAAEPGGPAKTLTALGDDFQNVVLALSKGQVEYDIGCEDHFARYGKAGPEGLVLGRRSYRTVVLPPGTENLNAATVALLQKHLDAGGAVLGCGEPPSRVDGAALDRAARLASHKGWRRVEARDLPARLPAAEGLSIRRRDGDTGLLYHLRRRLADGEVLFLVNTSIDAPTAGSLRAAAGGVEEWNAHSGRSSAYPCTTAEGQVTADFQLPPCGSLLLFLSKSRRPAAAEAPPVVQPLKPAGPIEVVRDGPNVLVLDYVDVAAGGKSLAATYYYEAAKFVFQQHGLKENPWDHAVQFGDELISQKFPAGSGFEATYRFQIADAVPADLAIVIERPDLYQIDCNGKRLTPSGAWWLDKAFGRMEIAAAARLGENVVTIKAAPFTMFHELERAFVLGDFSLRPSAAGYVIAAAGPLAVGRAGWNSQGMPFYSHGVSYRQRFQLDGPAAAAKVVVPAWYGGVARVRVNGKPAGHVFHAPWECDVSGLLRPGSNEVDVTVVGTLKNLLGPHHGKVQLGTAWPGMFRNGPKTPPPGEQYHTVAYGLFAPFEVRAGQP